MKQQKLFVFMLDALCDMDIAYMKTLPHFRFLFDEGSYIEQVAPVYPSLTYPCHVSILTGTYVNKHGIYHNEIVDPYQTDAPWFSKRASIQCKTLMDYAKEKGLRTCSLSWPVSGGANIDFNMPMIVPIGYKGEHPEQFFEGYATKELLDKYYPKYKKFLIDPEVKNLDEYTMAFAKDILKDYGQPDVMLVKMCDLDGTRHHYGVNNEHVRKQLAKHDMQFKELLDLIKEYGDFEHTNFVVLGDHGQSDVDFVCNINVLLKQAGFIKVDESDRMIDFDAYAHSAALSSWIQLKNPEDQEMKEKVFQFLCELKNDERFAITHIFTKEEALEKFGLVGPFDFVIESSKEISFGNTVEGEEVCVATRVGDYKFSKATHGGLPTRDHQTTFIACGPAVKKGVHIRQGNMIDEAPTMAAMLGIEMKDIDGKVCKELLR